MQATLRMLVLTVLVGGSLILAACGGGATTTTTTNRTAAPAAPVTLNIGSEGETFNYDKKTLEVSAGQEVTLNLKNNSVSQQHNWVLVKGDAAAADAVAAAGLTAGAAANYLPADKANVIAYAPVAEGGKTSSVKFTAPAAGTYTYVCTVPGHNVTMKGTLTVK